MTKIEAEQKLKDAGIKTPFRLARDANDEREKWLIQTRRPAAICDGKLVGSEILVDFESREFRIWTASKQAAKAVAGEHGLKFKGYDGEADVWIPFGLGDVLLPKFGARFRRQYDAVELEAMKKRASNARLNIKTIPQSPSRAQRSGAK